MKQIIVIVIAFFLIQNVVAQADKVLGIWLTQDGDSQVKIFKAADKKYYGMIKWLKTPNENGKPKMDTKNPREKHQTRPILDLMLLQGFNFKDNEWVDGTIYDPKTGNTYKCYMWFDGNNEKVLHVKGYIGLAIIGRQVEWTREADLRK